MSQALIEFHTVTKEFIFWRNKPRDIKKYLVSFHKKSETKKEIFSVLKDISFAIHAGEFVGIMGRNGAGKSTILKLISGVYFPNSGTIDIRGKVSPVLELGAGFVDDLSGYENIFLNAAILGYGRAKIAESLESIIEFSELGEHIYAPVRNYSSGMLVRLGFSIAVHTEAPILLFDEVLAVGDLGFQKKCIDKTNELSQQGRVIILVTHSPDQVQKYCTRCILIDEQRIVFDGDAAIGAQMYQKNFI